MDALLSQVLKGVLHRAALRLGETVLDIGRGTGASWIAAAVGVGPSGHLSGLDIAAHCWTGHATGRLRHTLRMP